MQGIIYTLLSDMVIEQAGMAAWNDVLNQVQPKSGGAYTAGQQYDDEELLSIVHFLSDKLSVPVADLIRQFGEYIFPALMARNPCDLPDGITAKEFLKQVDSVIHVGVKHIHPNAYLPTFRYEDPADNRLVMLYQSKRKMCTLAEGLIYGAGKHYDTHVDIKHTKCLHKDDDHCRLELAFGD
ncbi:heme NO-binding domain-containing protein [Aliikangiella coralliicola]|uniref:Guanylate cyclase n=1 Tax=Aliikangiella coralliicola TaxID=2592383 RepID=A0A545UDQ5_9GAMM|nr:heme NO-binding domain-containing protein [Aliikangiella coralliicola]TQV87595.1 guanylate cyclase [Aliikangiella coralliicola]